MTPGKTPGRPAQHRRADRRAGGIAGRTLFLPRVPARPGAAPDHRAHPDGGAAHRVLVQQPALAGRDRERRSQGTLSASRSTRRPAPARRTMATFRFRANIAASIWSAAAKAASSFTIRSASRAATRPPMRSRRWRITISSARRMLPLFTPTKRSAFMARSIAGPMSAISCWPRRRSVSAPSRRRRWRVIPA